MNNKLYILFLLVAGFSFCGYAAEHDQWMKDKALPVIHSSVTAYMHKTAAEQAPVWILFTDKGVTTIQSRNEAAALVHLPERTLRRRAKITANPQVDFLDLDVQSSYIDTLTALGLQKRHVSNWLNAVSGYLPRTSLMKVAALPFVREIRLLPQAINQRQPSFPTGEYKESTHENHLLNYGSSAIQLEMLNVPALHDMGLSGKGILICLLDTGYNLQHNALQILDVVADYDFVDHDSVTVNEPGKDTPGQDEHGAKVLSVIAGNMPGELYGPAFGASFLLGKTEDIDSESVIEEDNWVACIEWAERLGADIASSSVIYNEWYEYKDMDGNTAITTRIADIAVARGMIVCVSAGNERNSDWHYISAPADADSVITVGAIDKKGIPASFSSGGPTADGRIKPEVMALGNAVMAVNPNSQDAYSFVDGTSFSSPLIAGICALLLEAHPFWTPMQVREALMQTADRASAPDNNYGWGLADALAAMNYRCKGDVNGDDMLDSNDVMLMAQFILNKTQPDADVLRTADVNGDGLLDIRDIVQLINKLPSLPAK